MTQQPPPIYERLSGDDGKPNLAWTLFFQQQYDGDAGTVWTPNFVSLTTTGTPTITGRYYRLTKYWTLFSVVITPATDVSATAGTTYIDNYPLNFRGDGVVFAVTGNLGDGPGHIVSSNNRIYIPALSSVTVPITLIGMAEI